MEKRLSPVFVRFGLVSRGGFWFSVVEGELRLSVLLEGQRDTSEPIL